MLVILKKIAARKKVHGVATGARASIDPGVQQPAIPEIPEYPHILSARVVFT